MNIIQSLTRMGRAGKTRLSRSGLRAQQEKLAQLYAERKACIVALKEYTSNPEEDAAYIQARSELATLDGHIDEMELLIATAQVVPKRKNRVTVGVGSSVELETDDGQRFRCMIVNTLEANPSEGKISDQSPLGRQLLGKRMWATVTLRTLRGAAKKWRLVAVQ